MLWAYGLLHFKFNELFSMGSKAARRSLDKLRQIPGKRSGSNCGTISLMIKKDR
jgi:hypothetical protein